MIENTSNKGPTPTHIVAALRELISALDGRVPQVERPGETRIAAEARLLRRQAVARLEALQQRERSDSEPYDEEVVEAIMTDDGGPAPSQRPVVTASRPNK